MKKILITGVVAVAMALAAGKAWAVGLVLPLPSVAISGVISYQNSVTNNGTTQKGATKQVNFNNKSLLSMLNASPAVQTTLADLGLATNIPAGSSILFDIEDSQLMITNKSGFNFFLNGEDSVKSTNYNYGTLYIDQGELLSNYSISDKTGAGTEANQTGVLFRFDDSNGNAIQCAYGYGTLNWTFGATNGVSQKATVKVNLHPATLSAEVNSNSDALTTTCTITGSGTAIIPALGGPF
jgi:hypothetical protein